VKIVRGKKEEMKSFVTVFLLFVAVFEYYTQVIRFTYRARRATMKTVRRRRARREMRNETNEKEQNRLKSVFVGYS